MLIDSDRVNPILNTVTETDANTLRNLQVPEEIIQLATSDTRKRFNEAFRQNALKDFFADQKQNEQLEKEDTQLKKLIQIAINTKQKWINGLMHF